MRLFINNNHIDGSMQDCVNSIATGVTTVFRTAIYII